MLPVMNDVEEVVERAGIFFERYSGEDLKREVVGLIRYAFAMGKTYGIMEAAERLQSELDDSGSFETITRSHGRSDNSR